MDSKVKALKHPSAELLEERTMVTWRWKFPVIKCNFLIDYHHIAVLLSLLAAGLWSSSTYLGRSVK